MSLRSPLGRVLGHGSAKEGTGHFWSQRLTAISNAVLGVWFLAAMLGMESFTQAELRAWIAAPVNAVLLTLLTLSLARHASLGVQVVIEDYVHGPLMKVSSLIVMKFAHIVVAAAALFAILKIAVGGAA